MNTVPHFDEVISIARQARLNLARDGRLTQVAFIWVGNTLSIAGSRPLRSKIDKVAWSAVIRRMCIEMSADAVLTVVEVWTAKRRRGAPLDDIIGGVENAPNAREAVLFSLETMDGTWVAICPIIRVDGQGPAFPLPKQWMQGPTTGALFNILPDKKATNNYGGSQ